MPRKDRLPYWESSVFLSLFQNGDTEEKTYQREQAVLLLQDVQRQKTMIVTSVLSIAEARRGEGYPPLPGQEHATLSAFFRNSYIEVVPVTRRIAEMAAEFGEQFSLKPGDAIQLATAVAVNASVFLAWDRGFFRAVAMQGAPIPIERPLWTGVKQLSLEEGLENPH